MTIASISLRTTDEDWNEAFVAREGGLTGVEAIHKLGRLENLGVYWNTKSDALDPLPPAEWETAMQNLIYTNIAAAAAATTPIHTNNTGGTVAWSATDDPYSHSPPSGSKHRSHHNKTNNHKGIIPSDYRCLVYLLPTPNSLSVKITHSEHPKDKAPKIDIIVELTHLTVNLDKRQYQQLMQTIYQFGLLERQKQVSLLRPYRR